MRNITFFFILIPMLSFSQGPALNMETIGNSSRLSFESSTNNIFIGQDAGNATLTGNSNTFIGTLNGNKTTSGSRNLAIGTSAGSEITTGAYNINLGVGAGSSNKAGVANVNIGDDAGRFDMLGSNNVRIGDYAGRNSTGNGNVLIGRNAGLNLNGSDQLLIDNTSTPQALIHGDFAKDSLSINGDLNVTGELIVGSIDVSQITGVLGNGYSAVFPVVLDNTVSIEITGVVDSEFLITNSIGFEIDTFSLFGGSCFNPNTGFSKAFPLTFETDDATSITALNSWFASPDPRSMSIIIKDVSDSETSRYNLYEYVPSSTTSGSDGRTSFTLVHNEPPSNFSGFEIDENFGSSFSYNPATDKLVEIEGVSHDNFAPSVQVDYAKRVITLEMTYNEGAGLIDWINDFVSGTINKRSMSIIETTDGQTETSRENFFEVVPFKYEVIYGFGLNTKLQARIQLLYGCNEPG